MEEGEPIATLETTKATFDFMANLERLSAPARVERRQLEVGVAAPRALVSQSPGRPDPAC